MYILNTYTLLNWITSFVIFEIPLALFFLSISKKSDIVKNWYSGKNISIFNVLIQDACYAFCGIIIALNLFNYLALHNIINSSFIIFIFLLLFIQLMGDTIFALIIKNWPKKYSTYWIDYFKNYISKAGANALIGDSIWITSWALTYYIVSNYLKSFDIKIFLISLFLFLASAYSIKKSL
jgi:uncharacterized protein YacL